MCVEQRWIVNKYDGSKHYVKCGHCEACKQEKAIERTNRVRSEFNSDRECVFVTLSYADAYVPYVYKEDLYNWLSDIHDGKDSTLKVWRNFHAKNSNHGLVVEKLNKPISEWSRKDLSIHGKEFIPSNSDWFDFDNLHYVRNGRHFFHKDKLGVLNYKDVRDFLKRVGSNLKYKKYDKHYEVFYVGEYGGDYSRPHFHLLFSIPKGDYELFETTILASWSFSDHDALDKEVELARDPCSYLASYVNCDDSIPQILSRGAPFRPLHKYSHGFGMSLGDFSYKAVKEAYDRRNLSYDVFTTSNGVSAWRSVPIPKYVVNRYFPKWKGFSRLAPDEVSDVLDRPSKLLCYKTKCNLENSDILKITRTINNLIHRMKFESAVDFENWKRIYKDIHNLHYVSVLRDSLESVKFFDDWKYHYLNMPERLIESQHEFNSDSIDIKPLGCVIRVSPTLELYFEKDFQMDCNKWKHNLRKHNKLLDAWHMYNKNRKQNNELYKLKIS